MSRSKPVARCVFALQDHEGWSELLKAVVLFLTDRRAYVKNGRHHETQLMRDVTNEQAIHFHEYDGGLRMLKDTRYLCLFLCPDGVVRLGVSAHSSQGLYLGRAYYTKRTQRLRLEGQPLFAMHDELMDICAELKFYVTVRDTSRELKEVQQ